MLCNQHKEVFPSLLRGQRLKATPIRLAILEVFAHQPKPISILDLKAKISGDCDVVTLYRNADVLCKLGLLNRIRLGDKKDYYEFAQKAHHHHLVCNFCGKVSDIQDCEIGEISKQDLKLAGFAEVSRHSLEFFGICKQCNN
jgi:Fur family ferric uptake transcriptional regulator